MRDIHDINWLFNHYYKDNPELLRVVLLHSKMVAKKALDIVEKKKLPLDKKTVYIAAMLHDIGVIKCQAPDIKAHGDLPYLCHGIEGKKILENHGLYSFARICERHTGSGLTCEEIIKNNLPLPHQDLLPETLLEKLICYADKFFSKSGSLTKEKSIQQIENEMKKHGEESYSRFLELHRLFTFDR